MFKISKLLYHSDKYKILQNSRGYVLINVNGKYENHGHFKKKSTCHLCIRLMEEKTVPKSKYLQQAVLRISLDEKYKREVRIKQDKCRNKLAYVIKK